MSVVIETTVGDITVDLYTKERQKCSFNFLKLCKIRYYNYCLIKEIQKNSYVKIGDTKSVFSRLNGGGESIYWLDSSRSVRKKYFSAEKVPVIKHTKKGLLSFINNGKDKHGSQFFITLGENLDHLDKQGHTVFGEVVEGLDKFMESLLKGLYIGNELRRDVCISHTVILDDPFSDPPYIDEWVRQTTPDIPDHLIHSALIGLYDQFNDKDDRTVEEIQEELETEEAKGKAIVLEMLGDLPSADAKPPENVLFICKLNPITEEGDIERIFSRFGKINSVKIVKDPKTGQSLQYGFIEYDNKDDCEKAFLKMDNVLIDDRRIHVDFSQSVIKRRRV